MVAWELLKRLEGGGSVWFEDCEIKLGDLTGWDYDLIRNPASYSLTKPKGTAKVPNKYAGPDRATQDYRIKTWGWDIKDYVWVEKQDQYVHKSVAKGK